METLLLLKISISLSFETSGFCFVVFNEHIDFIDRGFIILKSRVKESEPSAPSYKRGVFIDQ